uniref:Uncharacterized protein n=1 Tax=Globodera rostochiensis TaxID=31243 RepID=A0A914I015_GLORO
MHLFNVFLNYLFIFSHFVCLSDAAFLEGNVFGICLAHLQDQYLRLIFDVQMSKLDHADLSLQLGAVQVHLDIEAHLGPLEKNDDDLKRLHKKIKMPLALLEKRRKYDELKGEIERRLGAGGRMRFSDLCRLWDFNEETEMMSKVLAQMKEVGTQRGSQCAVSTTRLDRDSGPTRNCDQFDDANFLTKEQPNWALRFKRYISMRHLHFIDKEMLAGEKKLGRKVKVQQWFSTESIAGEGELRRRLRSMNVLGELEQLKLAKRRMKQALFHQEEQKQLEILHPMTMAIDVIDSSFLKNAYATIFEFAPNSVISNEWFLWLERAFMGEFGRISQK